VKRTPVGWVIATSCILFTLSACAVTPNKQLNQTSTPSKTPQKNIQTNKKPSEGQPSAPTLYSASTSWPTFGNNVWQDRYSPDIGLTPASISRTQLAYSAVLPTGRGGNETFPLEENGVLYVTTSEAHVLALDAATGKIIWSYAPNTNVQQGIPQINPGVAISSDRVFVLTPDDQLIALNRTDGKPVFDVTVASQDNGYFESMAPLIVDGRVIVGSAGGDEGVRGFIAAFDATNGKSLWKFYTVPKRGQDWMPAAGDHGGGAVWTTPAYDPEQKRIYFGSGNPSPDYYGKARPGPNLYTDAVIALDATSGTLAWFQQEVPHDLWDYDVASPPVLFPLGDKTVVGEAGKDGYWYEWDASNGKPIIDPVAFVREDHRPPTSSGTKEWPGAAGGANYGPSAYDPLTNEVYVAGINGPEILYARPTDHSGRSLDFGTGQNPAPAAEWTGTITAIHADTGQIAWQINTPTPPIGGVSVNAGGIVYFGQANGALQAVSAKTGQLLWHVDAGAPIGSAPIIYDWQGKTYLTVVTGGAKSLTNLFPYDGDNRVLTYEVKPQ